MSEFTDAQYIEAANAQASDDLEIDPDAKVSRGDDGLGAWVSVWLWIADSEVQV
jgi:hypothetical protein